MAFDSTGWDGYYEFSSDHTKVDAAYPYALVLDLSQFPYTLFTRINSDGGDIRITTGDGSTELARGVVDVDTTAEKGWVYLNADGIDTDVDVVYRLYAGNSDASDYPDDHQYGMQNVFSSDHKGYWRCNIDNNTLVDESNAGNDGTVTGAAQSSGVIGDAASYDGSDDETEVPHSSDLDVTTCTFYLWAKRTGTLSTPNYILGRPVSSSPTEVPFRFYLRGTDPDITLGWGFYDGETKQIVDDGGLVSSDNVWFHYMMIAEESNGDTILTLIRNGSVIDSQTFSGTLPIRTSSLFFGSGGGERFGHFDEDEIAFVHNALNVDIAKTIYNNQNDPASFWTVGNWVSLKEDWYDSNWKYRRKITSDHTKVDASYPYALIIDLSNFPSEFFNEINSGGSDIRMTKEDKITELARGTREVDISAKTGLVYFYADDIATDEDTDFYLYYGNSNASDYADDHQYGMQSVFSSDHKFYSTKKRQEFVDYFGLLDPSGDYHSANWGVYFELTDEDIRLTESTVDASGSGDTTFELWKYDEGVENPQDGTKVDEVTVSLVDGKQNITLNLETNGQGDYWLGRTSGIDLLRTDDDQNYPFTAKDFGLEFIQGRESNSNDTNNRWYYLFNLKVEKKNDNTTVYCQDSSIKDETSNNNNGTVYGASSTTGKVGEALEYDGIDDHIDIPSNESLSIEDGDFTILFWMKAKTWGVEDTVCVIEKISGDDYNWIIRQGWQGSTLQFNILDFGAVTTSDSLAEDTWYFGSVVYNVDEARIYLDGTLQNSSTTDISGNIDDLSIGGYWHEGNFKDSRYFDGFIDDVSIQTIALSDDTISTIYNNQNDPASFWFIGVQEEKETPRRFNKLMFKKIGL